MSLRSLKIPGKQLGLGTFVNSNIDAKRKVVYFGVMTWTAGNFDRTFTQGQTRMATIEVVLLGRDFIDDKGSGSCHYTVGTVSGGTVKVHNKSYTSAAATNNRATKMSYWMVGSPDPQRIVI